MLFIFFSVVKTIEIDCIFPNVISMVKTVLTLVYRPRTIDIMNYAAMLHFKLELFSEFLS